jgi:hypothetical protein
MTVPVPLSQLVAPATSAEVLSLELAIATALGLSVTSWEPLDPSRTIYQGQAQIISLYAGTVNLIAQGGYANYAAQMVDGNGAPITTWMDLLTPNLYNTLRFQASFAAGPVPFTNGNATTYSYTPNNPLHFQYPTSGGATYTSVGSGSLAGNSSGTVNVVADAGFSGSAGNAATGTILQLITPLAGVTIQALTLPLVGAPLETNQALLLRSLNMLGSLSGQLLQVQQGTTPVPPNPAAPTTAYDYVATSIPTQTSGLSSAVWPYYVTAKITKSQTVGNTVTGVVNVYLANAAGAPTAGDVAVAAAAIAALVTGQCITAIVQAAGTVTVTVAYTIYYRRSSGYTVTQAQAAILLALTGYFSAFPIGGITTTTSGIMPYTEVEDVIFDALPGAVDLVLTLNGGKANIAIGSGNVAVLGVVTPGVVFV